MVEFAEGGTQGFAVELGVQRFFEEPVDDFVETSGVGRLTPPAG